jgi:capsid protein
MAAGFGVPYAAMTGDLRQTSYGSIRAGLVEFRRRVEAIQHHVMVFQFCRPVWLRWMDDAFWPRRSRFRSSAYDQDAREFQRVKWIPPRWEWIDPLKDRQAEKLAVDAGFKARSDVVEAEGYDPEENDARIAADHARERVLRAFAMQPLFIEAAKGHQIAEILAFRAANGPRAESFTDTPAQQPAQSTRPAMSPSCGSMGQSCRAPRPLPISPSRRPC